MPLSEEIRRKLAAAHREAQQVHDSPVRADRLAATVSSLAKEVDAAADASDELRARVLAALADAERVLRRDDDGREAARHLATAMSLAQDRPKVPPPF